MQVTLSTVASFHASEFVGGVERGLPVTADATAGFPVLIVHHTMLIIHHIMLIICGTGQTGSVIVAAMMIIVVARGRRPRVLSAIVTEAL